MRSQRVRHNWSDLGSTQHYVSLVHLSRGFHLCVSKFSWDLRLIFKNKAANIELYNFCNWYNWEPSFGTTYTVIWEIQRYIRLVFLKNNSYVSVLVLHLEFQLKVQQKRVVWRRVCQYIFVVVLFCANLLFLSNVKFFILRFETFRDKQKPCIFIIFLAFILSPTERTNLAIQKVKM